MVAIPAEGLEEVGRRGAVVRSTDRGEHAHSVGHPFVDDHLPRVQATQAVSDDVDFIALRSAEYFLRFRSELLRQEPTEPAKLTSDSSACTHARSDKSLIPLK